MSFEETGAGGHHFNNLLLKVSEDKVRVKMSPVRVLNVLGEAGYRVIGASSAGRNGAYAWKVFISELLGATVYMWKSRHKRA